MRYDQNGRYIRGTHKTTIHHDNMVVDLESRHNGISDTILNKVLQIVHEERTDYFHSILDQLQLFSNRVYA